MTNLAPIFAAKKLLRKELKGKLGALTKQEKTRESEVVAGRVLQHKQYLSAQNICVYVSMPEEVCTDRIIRDILQSNKTLYVPYFNQEEMVMVRIRDMVDYSTLPVDTYGVRQPRDYKSRDTATNTTGLDLILCPGLGFTNAGLRIGRGKGYYDNYLSQYESVWQTLPYTIGLAFKVQVLDHVPTTGDDRVLDQIISPS